MVLKIDIITKTYNRKSYLGQCIDSVQALNTEPYENKIAWKHKIYDDGSTDDTRELFAKRTYRNLQYTYHPINVGIPKTANIALSQSDSDWIFELDSDDFVPSRILANFYQASKAHPDTQWFVYDFYSVNTQGEYVIGKDYYGWIYKSPIDVLTAIFSGRHYIQHNVIYKRSLWQKVGKYHEDLQMGEDLDLYVRFLLDGNMPRYLPYISHFHRIHDTNISKYETPESHWANVLALAKKYSNELNKLGIEVGLRL
jgi:glycosyltransferase involved in cell wall biosynthesis